MNSLYELINQGRPFDRVLAVRDVTLDFASIAAAGTGTLNVTVPGAQVGDAVLLGLPASVNAGLVLNAHVSAADTVTVRAFNITAVAIDPASSGYSVLVFKL